MTTPSGNNRIVARILTIGFLAATVLYLLLIVVGAIPEGRRLRPPELALAGGSVVLAILFLEYSLEELSLGVTGLTARIRRVEASVGSIREEVADLFLTSLAPTLVEKLEGIVQGDSPFDDSPSLRRELILMRDLGFIGDFTPEAITPRGNLATLVTITDQGRRFVRARRQLLDDAR